MTFACQASVGDWVFFGLLIWIVGFIIFCCFVTGLRDSGVISRNPTGWQALKREDKYRRLAAKRDEAQARLDEIGPR